MRDTPETDKAERMAFSGEYMVPTEFARQLECERDEAREAIIGWENKWKCAIEMAAKAEVERDEARAWIGEIFRLLGLPEGDMGAMENFRRERDEALAAESNLKHIVAGHCDEQLRLVFENRRLLQEIEEARSALAECCGANRPALQNLLKQ